MYLDRIYKHMESISPIIIIILKQIQKLNIQP